MDLRRGVCAFALCVTTGFLTAGLQLGSREALVHSGIILGSRQIEAPRKEAAEIGRMTGGLDAPERETRASQTDRLPAAR